MKITVKSKEKVEEKMTIDNIEPGIVFQYDNGGPIALKLRDGEVVLLRYSSGHDWFQLSNDTSFKNDYIKILGRLDEIIVVKE